MTFIGFHKDLGTLSIYNWSMLYKEDELGYLLKRFRKVKYSARLKRIAIKLFDQYVKDIGLSRKYLEHVDKLKERQAYQLAYINGDRSQKAFAEITDKELNQDLGVKIEKSIYKTCAEIFRSTGQRIDPKKTSVIEFEEIVKGLK